MISIVWTNNAIKRRDNIFDYIADDNPDAAIELDMDIEAATQNLRNFPNMGRIGKVSGTRELIVRRNYIVVYCYVPESEIINILTVRNVAQQYPSNGKDSD